MKIIIPYKSILIKSKLGYKEITTNIISNTEKKDSNLLKIDEFFSCKKFKSSTSSECFIINYTNSTFLDGFDPTVTGEIKENEHGCLIYLRFKSLSCLCLYAFNLVGLFIVIFGTLYVSVYKLILLPIFSVIIIALFFEIKAIEIYNFLCVITEASRSTPSADFRDKAKG